MDESLVEVALLRRRGTPGELELLVGFEEPPGPDERQAGLELIPAHVGDATEQLHARYYA